MAGTRHITSESALLAGERRSEGTLDQKRGPVSGATIRQTAKIGQVRIVSVMQKRTYRFGDSDVALVVGNLLDSDAEVLVSSDDYFLTMGGGVSADIRRAGGSAIALDAAKKVPSVPGDVVVTTAGALDAKFIFHAITIGPGASELGSREIVRRATRRCLELGDALGITSLALPPLGTGRAQFSPDDAAVELASVIVPHLAGRQRPLSVSIHFFDPERHRTEGDYAAFFEEFAKRLPSAGVEEVQPPRAVDSEPARPPESPVRQGDLKTRKRLQDLEREREQLEEDLRGLRARGATVEEIAAAEEQLRLNLEARLEAKDRGDSFRGVEVFISYAHEDEELLDSLRDHLSRMRMEGLITDWHDRSIEAGANWRVEIDAKLESARIVLLLISKDFMGSEYCTGVEMERALQRDKSGEAVVIPVILRAADWQLPALTSLQALPKDAEPIVKWTDQDEAFLDVVQGIRRRVESLTVA